MARVWASWGRKADSDTLMVIDDSKVGTATEVYRVCGANFCDSLVGCLELHTPQLSVSNSNEPP